MPHNLFGYSFSECEDMTSLLNHVFHRDLQNVARPPFLVTLNVDQIVKFSSDWDLKNSIANAEIIVADGAPVAKALALLTKWRGDRLTGSDFFPLFIERALNSGDRILFVVASEGVAEKVRCMGGTNEVLVAPDLRSMSQSQIKETLSELMPRLDPNSWDFVYVGLGLPVRERVALALVELGLRKPLYLLLGAAIEFYFSEQRRAPRWMRENFLEWFYRLLMDPRRLSRRYLIESWPFLWLLLLEVVRRITKWRKR